MPITIIKGDEATVSIRFPRRLYFGLGLLALQQRRSVNSLVQWAVERLLDDPNVGLNTLDQLWDLDEPDRVINIGMKQPRLLDHWERVWKIIREDRSLWTTGGEPNREEIRRRWQELKSGNVARKKGRPRMAK